MYVFSPRTYDQPEDTCHVISQRTCHVISRRTFDVISPRPNHMMILSNTSSDSDCSDQSGCARDDMIGLKLNFVEVLFYIAKQTGISDAQYLKYYNGDRIKDGVLLLPLLLRLLLVLPLLLWL
eukprot:scpid110117/ scgid29559/ 